MEDCGLIDVIMSLPHILVLFSRRMLPQPQVHPGIIVHLLPCTDDSMHLVQMGECYTPLH